MGFIEWLANNNPPVIVAVIAGICIIITQTAVIAKLLLPALISGKGKDGKHKNKAAPKIKNNHLIKIWKKLDAIVTDIEKLTKRLQNLSDANKKQSEQIYLSTIYQDKVHIIDRMTAAVEYFMLGFNGNVSKYVVTDLVMKTKENITHWEWVVNKYKNVLPKNHIFYDHFHATLETIRKQIM